MISTAYNPYPAARPWWRHRTAAAAALLLCLPLALPIAARAADTIQEVDAACDANVGAEIQAWSRIGADLRGDWQAFGSVGEDKLEGAEVRMKFEGDVLVEEIGPADSVSYRSVTGVKEGKTVGFWTDAAGGCRELEGSLDQEEANLAVRKMGDVDLEYERWEKPSTCLAAGAGCRSDADCCKDCKNGKCT